MADVIFILHYLFAGGLLPSCLDAADTNDDAGIDVSDGVYLVRHLFALGPAPPPPYPACGPDPTPGGPGCVAQAPCAP